MGVLCLVLHRASPLGLGGGRYDAKNGWVQETSRMLDSLEKKDSKPFNFSMK